MGIVTDHYLKEFREMSPDLARTWKQSGLRQRVNSLIGFDYQEGEILNVEGEDDPYEVVDHFTLTSIYADKEIYLGDRLTENHNGERTRSYDMKPIREEEILE